MELVFFGLLVALILSDIFGTQIVSADRSSRRQGSLNGRRGEMDDDFRVIDADLSGVIDQRTDDDNRTPTHRDVALASLEILVAGGGEESDASTVKPPQETLEKITRRPLQPCRNGGIRLLGSFCYCPSDFMGRYCEIYRHNSSCGRIPHGRWVYMNCNSCHCIAGVLRCQPHAMAGCETEIHSTPKPRATVDLAYDDYEAMLGYPNSAISRSNSALNLASWSAVFVLLLNWCLHRR